MRLAKHSYTHSEVEISEGLREGSRRSREFPTFSFGTSRGCVSLTKCSIGVFFSMLESSSL